MTDILRTVDTWFLLLAVTLLGIYFLWSIKGLFNSLQSSLEELKKLIKELFDMRNNHETRITALETRCDIMHGEDPKHPVRSPHYVSDDHKD